MVIRAVLNLFFIKKLVKLAATQLTNQSNSNASRKLTLISFVDMSAVFDRIAHDFLIK